MKKRSSALVLSCLFALSSCTATVEEPPAERLAGPVRPCGACRAFPEPAPAEPASLPGANPPAPSSPELLAGPVRPCGACRLEGPRGASAPPPPEV